AGDRIGAEGQRIGAGIIALQSDLVVRAGAAIDMISGGEGGTKKEAVITVAAVDIVVAALPEIEAVVSAEAAQRVVPAGPGQRVVPWGRVGEWRVDSRLSVEAVRTGGIGPADHEIARRQHAHVGRKLLTKRRVANEELGAHLRTCSIIDLRPNAGIVG